MTMPHPLSLDDSQLKVVLDRARRIPVLWRARWLSVIAFFDVPASAASEGWPEASRVVAIFRPRFAPGCRRAGGRVSCTIKAFKLPPARRYAGEGHRACCDYKRSTVSLGAT